MRTLTALLHLLAVACGAADDPYGYNANAWDPAPLLDEKTAVGCAASELDRNLVIVVDDPAAESRLIVELQHELRVGEAISITEEVGPDAIAHIDLGPGWDNPCDDGPPATGPEGESFIGLGGFVTVDLRPDMGNFTILRGTTDFVAMEFDGPRDGDAFMIEDLSIDQLIVDAE